MMNAKSVLLIGPPFLYQMVDDQLLWDLKIKPIYAYQKQASGLRKDKSVFYDSLCEHAIAGIIEQERPEAVVCFNDNFLLQTAGLRDRYQLNGYGSEVMSQFKIKSVMYECVKPVVSVPDTVIYQLDLNYADLRDRLGQSVLFIKPDSLAGSEGTCQIADESQFKTWRQTVYQTDRQYICQPYLDLPLVHCELIIENGRVIYCQARRYSYPNHLFLQGHIIASFPIADSILRGRIEAEARMVAQQLNFSQGVMHTEFFVTTDQSLIFLETNIRQAGGAINLIHHERCGISMETAMILLELGISVPIKPNLAGYHVCGYIPQRCGNVQAIELPALRGRYQFEWHVSKGQRIEQPNSASHKAASFMGYSHCLEDLQDDFRILEKHSIIRYD